MSEIIKYPKFRFVILLMALVGTVAQSVVMISPAPLIGEIVKTLEINLGTATIAFMAVFNLALAIGCVVGGAIVDKIGLVRSYILGLVLMAVGSLLVPVVGTSLGILIVLRIIQGLGAGPINGSMSKLAADWFPMKERSMVAGIQGMAVSLGVAIGFIFSPNVFASTSSWQAAMGWTSVFCLVGLVITIVVALGPKPPVVIVETNAASNFKPYLRLPLTWICVLTAVLLSWVFSAFNDLTPAYLAIPSPVGLGKGPVGAGQYMMVFQIAFMLGAVVSGFLVQKVFGGKEKPVAAMGFLLAAIFCFAIKLPAVYANPTTLVACLVIAGVFMGMPMPTVFSFIAKNYPEHATGKVGGLAMGVGIFGGSIGVVVGSIALHNTGGYQLSITIVSVVAVLGLISALRLTTPKDLIGSGNKTIGA